MGTKLLHFWWTISILGVIIIGLVSFILTDKIAGAEKIMDYISYASVILSITLSVFAILYTYTSNVQIQQQFEKINAAATNIQSASDSLITTENQLNVNLGTILERLDNINQSQKEIYSQVTNVNNQVEDPKINNHI